MQAASREALAVTEDKFKELALGMDAAGLAGAANELCSVTRLLVREVVLRKYLTEATIADDSKIAVVERLFVGRVATPIVELLKVAVAQRWSAGRDLTTALDRFARLAVLIEAEREDRIESVEDELFRFGRIVDANPRLATLLGDATKPVDARLRLLTDVVGSRVCGPTLALLEQVVRWPHSTHFAAVVDQLAELAAERRGESVAHVIAAEPLTEQQGARLATVLSRIYGRTISVQLEIDPEILGGLKITVGDEVIDGTIASRLAAAASQLPR